MEDKVLQTKACVEVLKEQLNDSSTNQLRAVMKIRRHVDRLRGLSAEMEERISNGEYGGSE